MKLQLFYRNLLAERYKLKRTPILWLCLLGGVLVTAFMSLIYLLRIPNVAEMTDPWQEFFGLGLNFVSILLMIPFVVLVTNSLVNVEHKSNAWKQLYCLPQSRGQVYFSKLLVVLVLVAITYLIYVLSSLFAGWLLGILVPEYGFQNANPDMMAVWSNVFKSYISIMGIIGIQYWMSYRFKNYLAPLGIGMLGFILSLMIASKPSIAQYVPYCYAMFTSPESLNNFDPSMINRVLVLSLSFFALFSLLGFYQENKGDIK